MNDKFWLIKYSLSVLLAVLASQASTIISGYGISGFMFSVELTIFVVYIAAFLIVLYRLYRNGLTLNPNPTKGFDAKKDNTLSDFLLFKSHSSVDIQNGIVINPLLVSYNIINPISMLSILYLMFSCSIRIILLHSSPTMIDFAFLLAQTWIVYCSSLILFMALFQIKNIYEFLTIKAGIDPLEENTMKFLQKLFKTGVTDSANTPIANLRNLNTSGKGQSAKEYLAPVVQLLSRNYGARFVEVYQSALHLQNELNNVTKEFNVSESYFSDDLMVISEILDIYYPDVVAKSKKALSNTNMTEQIKSKFQSEMEKSIISNVERFGFNIKNINNKILSLRLSAFDTTEIDPYISSAKTLHRQIKMGSGEWSNKHLVIANSVINELLPSLIDSWALSSETDQRETVLNNFKGMVDFLEAQLTALNNTEKSNANNGDKPLSLELDRAVDLGELNSRIKRDAQYIENLNNHWN